MSIWIEDKECFLIWYMENYDPMSDIKDQKSFSHCLGVQQGIFHRLHGTYNRLLLKPLTITGNMSQRKAKNGYRNPGRPSWTMPPSSLKTQGSVSENLGQSWMRETWRSFIKGLGVSDGWQWWWWLTNVIKESDILLLKTYLLLPGNLETHQKLRTCFGFSLCPLRIQVMLKMYGITNECSQVQNMI